MRPARLGGFVSSRALALLVLAIALAAPAASRAAGSSFTAPAPPNATDAYCVVQNVGSRAAEVHAILHEDNGTLIEETLVTMPPGQTLMLVGTTVDAEAALAYCEFAGLSKAVRGYLLVSSGPVLPASR
jgi:hypothetical protein